MCQKSKFLPYSTFPVVKNKWLCVKVPWQRFKWDVFEDFIHRFILLNWKVQLLELKRKTLVLWQVTLLVRLEFTTSYREIPHGRQLKTSSSYY